MFHNEIEIIPVFNQSTLQRDDKSRVPLNIVFFISRGGFLFRIVHMATFPYRLKTHYIKFAGQPPYGSRAFPQRASRLRPPAPPAREPASRRQWQFIKKADF
jgi:hypothetical protein